MSQSWETIQRLPHHVEEKIRSLYSPLFPIEVRVVLSEWLQSINSVNRWEDMDPDLHSDYLLNNVLPALFVELRKEISESNNKTSLETGLQCMQQAYAYNPQHLMRVLLQTLVKEAAVVRDSGNMEPNNNETSHQTSDPIPESVVEDPFEVLKRMRDHLQQTLSQMKQENETLVLDYNTYKRKQEFWSSGQHFSAQQLTQIQKEKQENESYLKQKAETVRENRGVWVQTFESCIQMTEQLMSQVLDQELDQWKRRQQLAGNGVPVLEDELRILQPKCESLAETLWLNVRQVQSLEDMCSTVHLAENWLQRLPHLKSRVRGLLQQLVQRTFVVELQPPQVLRTTSRFSATVRFLVGVKLNVHMSSPDVRVSIANESSAWSHVLSEGKQELQTSGKILNNVTSLEYERETNILSAHLKNMQLKNFKHADKKSGDKDSVLDQKSTLIFESRFAIADSSFSVQAMSLPVVVVVHGVQEPHATATVTWDNAFPVPGRTSFQELEHVTWAQVKQVLSSKFQSWVGTGLSDQALNYLAEKAFRNSRRSDYDSLLISRSQFVKDCLPNKNFSFWDWFFGVMRLTKDHMRDLWNEGAIVGFVSRSETQDRLLDSAVGTFMLRFSDSEKEAITVAWVGETDDGLRKQVFMLQPFTGKDFAIRGLAERICDLPELLFLYPGTAKDLFFKPKCKAFTEPDKEPVDGYVKHELALTLSGTKRTSFTSPSPASITDFSTFSPDASLCQDMSSVTIGNGSGSQDVLKELVESTGLMDFSMTDLCDLLEPQQ